MLLLSELPPEAEGRLTELEERLTEDAELGLRVALLEAETPACGVYTELYRPAYPGCTG